MKASAHRRPLDADDRRALEKRAAKLGLKLRYPVTPEVAIVSHPSVIVALTEWGDTWLQQGPVEFCDSDSGDCVKLTFVPVAEGEQVRPSQIIARRRETPR